MRSDDLRENGRAVVAFPVVFWGGEAFSSASWLLGNIFSIFAYCGLVVEIPTELLKFETFCSPNPASAKACRGAGVPVAWQSSRLRRQWKPKKIPPPPLEDGIGGELERPQPHTGRKVGGDPRKVGQSRL